MGGASVSIYLKASASLLLAEAAVGIKPAGGGELAPPRAGVKLERVSPSAMGRKKKAEWFPPTIWDVHPGRDMECWRAGREPMWDDAAEMIRDKRRRR